MNIQKACWRDVREIPALQYISYQSEAALLNNDDILPLKQTVSNVEKEYDAGTVLKALDDTGAIIGSVRAYRESGTVYIGKLIVHPAYRCMGIGTALMREIERVCPYKRYELFTSDKSPNNLKLYKKLGYVRFQEREISPAPRLVYLEKARR